MNSRGRLKWLHAASTGSLTYLEMNKKRGKEAMDGIGILNGFKGAAVHGCFASYWNYGCVHSLCNAHLLCGLAFIDQTAGQRRAEEMTGLLLGIKEAVEIRRLGKKVFLPKAGLLKYVKRYNILIYTNS
jgi:transposase